MKRLLIGLMVVSIVASVWAGMETEYEAATDGTAEVVFSPDPYAVSPVVVGQVKHDYSGTVKFYAKGGAGRSAIVAANASTVTVESTSGYLTNESVVVYDVSADAVYYRTISDTNTTNIILSSAITSFVGASGDQIYEVTQQSQMELLVSSTVTNKTDLPQYIFVTPEDSPLYIVATTTGGASSNVTMTATVDK